MTHKRPRDLGTSRWANARRYVDEGTWTGNLHQALGPVEERIS